MLINFIFCLNKNAPKSNLPKAKSTMPPATATADPLEHPPGTRSEAAGFVGVPKNVFSPWILHKIGPLSQHTHEIKNSRKLNLANVSNLYHLYAIGIKTKGTKRKKYILDF